MARPSKKLLTDIVAGLVTANRAKDRETRSEALKQVAAKIVDLRSHFEWEDRPDWAGRSGEYRDLINRLYREAELPSDAAGGIQSGLRYHVGNLVRQTAPAEDLSALGLSAEGPRDRVVKARKAARAVRRESRQAAPVALSRESVAPAATDPKALLELALSAVRAAAPAAGDRQELQPVLRELAEATFDLMARR